MTPAEPMPSRHPTRAAGAAVLLAVGLVLAGLLDASPRAIATVFPLAAGIATIVLVRARGGEAVLDVLRRSGPALAVAAFGLYALTSVLWTADVRETVSKSLYLLLLLLVSLGGIGLWLRLEAETRRRAARGAAIVLAVALVLGAIEATTGQLLMRKLYTLVPLYARGLEGHMHRVDGVVVAISDTNIKRRVAMLALTVWPLLLLVVQLAPSRRRWPAVALVAVLTLAMVYIGPHHTSQVAGVASLAVFGIAWRAPALARKALAAVLVAWTLLAPPLAWGIARADLEEKSWVPLTARHRFVIWRATADEVAKSPILGVGANATRKIFEAEEAKPHEVVRDGEFVVGLTRHAHNAYLQVWYELGAVGAVLFALIWGAFALASGRLAARLQPFALAQVTTIAAVAASSYGIWQMWFLASIAFGAVALVCAATLGGAGPASDAPEDVPEQRRSPPAEAPVA